MPHKRPAKSWMERTLASLTPRQRGFFLRRRLLPFTTAKEISERAQVPYARATMLLRQLSPENKPKPLTQKALYEFYARAKRAGPKRNWVLESPHFWYVRTIENMAPHAVAREIYEELSKHANGRPIPSPRIIASFIRANSLRTQEEQTAAVSRANSKASRVRKKNKLSRARRRQLLFQVYPLLEKWIKETIIPKDEMIGLIFDRLEREVQYFDPSKLKSNDPITVKWKKFVRSRVGFMMIDAIRTKFGRGKKVRVYRMLPDEVESKEPAQKSTTPQWGNLINSTKPDSVQRKIIDLLSKGYSRRRVAMMLKISPNTVNVHLVHIRKHLPSTA
jgi:DNA-directed RNA polymerase specialized sigma24 family protein